MTAPISFPSISPPNVVKRESDFDDFAQLMVAIMQGRQQLGLRKQEIELERQRTASSIEEAGQRTAESRARMKADEEKRKQELEAIDAGRIASRYLADAMLESGGNLTPEVLNRARAGAYKENPKLGELIFNKFDAQVQGMEQARTALAERRIKEPAAEVAPENVQLGLQKGRLEVQRAQVALSTDQIQQAIEGARLQLDPQRAQIAEAHMSRGVPAGQAYRLAGAKLPVGIPENFVHPDADATGRRSAAQERAGPLLNMFRVGRAVAEGAGAVPLTFLNTWRTRSNSGIVEGLANVVSSDKQNQLVTGYRLMANAFRFSISGAASAVAEENRLAAILTPVVGDNDDTLRAKKLLWDAVEGAMADASTGATTPVNAMDRIIEIAKQNKAPPATLRVLQQQRADAQKFEQSSAYKVRTGAQSSAPADVTGDPIVGRFFRPTP